MYCPNCGKEYSQKVNFCCHCGTAMFTPTPVPKKPLTLSRTDKKIAGVCGGFAEYLNLDPTLVRVLWIFLTIFGGSGIILYIIAYFVIPLNSHQTPAMPSSGGNSQAANIVGGILVFVGLILLLDNLDFFHFHRWMRMSWEFLLPVMLIGAGVYMLMRRRADIPPPSDTGTTASGTTEGRNSTGQTQSGQTRRLERSLLDRKFLGVCGGLGNYLGIDPTIVRILFVMFVLMSFGFGFVLYFILFLIMPEEQLITL